MGAKRKRADGGAEGAQAQAQSPVRAKRQVKRQKPNLSLYVGYVEDDEDIETIMARFSRLEEFQQKQAQPQSTDAQGTASATAEGEAPPAAAQPAPLSEEDLQRVFNLSHEKIAMLEAPATSEFLPRTTAAAQGELVEDLADGPADAPYEVIEDYVPVVDGPDGDYVMSKMKTLKTVKCGGRCCGEPENMIGTDDFFPLLAESVTAAPIACACRAQRAECGPKCGCAKSKKCANRGIADGAHIVVGRDCVEVPLVGIDAYTRDKLWSLLPAEWDDAQKAAFVEKRIIPAVHARCVAGERPNIVQAVEDLTRAAVRKANPDVADAAKALLERMRAEGGAKVFKTHPKGRGVICTRAEGIPRDTYLGCYVGEIYPPWRWYEKEDAGNNVRRAVGQDGLPIFYNIMLERHANDEGGYDVMFVDPKRRGNPITRFSHSCDPAAYTAIVASGGQFRVAVYAARDIAQGEEITFDYLCRTDDPTEVEKAICLCGTAQCRGSFVHYEDDPAAHLALDAHHGIAPRVACLVDACTTPSLSREDEAVLARHACKGSMLGGAPQWLRKHVTNVLRFVESERRTLPDLLLAAAARVSSPVEDHPHARVSSPLENHQLARVSPPIEDRAPQSHARGENAPCSQTASAPMTHSPSPADRHEADNASAGQCDSAAACCDRVPAECVGGMVSGQSSSDEAQAREAAANGVYLRRLQSVAVACDKVRHFLHAQKGAGAGPDKSPAVVSSGAAPLVVLSDAESLRFLWGDDDMSLTTRIAEALAHAAPGASRDIAAIAATARATLLSNASPSKKNAGASSRELLLRVAHRLAAEGRATQPLQHAMLAAAAGVVLHAHTRVRFAANPKHKGFKSKHAEVGRISSASDAGVVVCKSYGADYALAQLAMWTNEAAANIEALFAKNARGWVALPDVSGCFGAQEGGRAQRAAAACTPTELDAFVDALSGGWAGNTAFPSLSRACAWTYKTKQPLGSPFVDAALAAGALSDGLPREAGGARAVIDALVADLAAVLCEGVTQ